jgi:hypothetical protein
MRPVAHPVRTAVAALLAAALALAASGPSPAASPAAVDLAGATWTRNGEASDLPTVEGEGADAVVRLPCDGMGVRWGTVFTTEGRATARLFLDFEPGPEGLLFEVVVDGERLPPPRDGWRPTRRRLVVDLGPRWLGEGRHLLELVAREDRPDGALHLAHLELRAPD